MNKDRLRITDDGSHTLFSNNVGENYHSSFGAIQESKHIFINAGLATVDVKNLKRVNVLEVGTGTGLNIVLAYLWGKKNNAVVKYDGYEPFPISTNEVALLNYPTQLFVDDELFYHIHDNFGKVVKLSEEFSLLINEDEIQNSKLDDNYYDVVFFDAFSPDSQPEMWTADVFMKIFNSLKSRGVLTTYSCKGIVKRALIEAGFTIEKLPGPPGKREFLRAWKK